MKNITIIVVAFASLGIAYLFLKDRKEKELINLASAIPSQKTAIPLPLLPGTSIGIGLKPRPGNGMTLPIRGYLPKTLFKKYGY